MDEWSIIWQQKEAFITGFQTTMVIFVLSSIISFAIGICLLYALENIKGPFKTAITVSINTMRTLPFLILVYLLYYGLPQVGIRMDAWMAGLISLSVYHGMYYCEIFRGMRKGLDSGYIEAAHTHGFSKFNIFRRIVMPNVLFKSIPLIANQLIIGLKDTAFLSIITVGEITAAANSVQSTYFIPLNAFIIAIALYWIISIGVEQIARKLTGTVQKRGLSYA